LVWYLMAELGNPREVVTISFAHRGVIHLDTKFNIVGKNVALFARKSFQPDTVRWLERHFDLIEATDEETCGIEINALALGGNQVIVQEKSEPLRSARGLTHTVSPPSWVPISDRPRRRVLWYKNMIPLD